jgi:DNA uptake protein ComE-like DNA-binding protein
VKREILIAAGLSVALAGAAFLRPPRAVPAFAPEATASSPAAHAVTLRCGFPGCHGERSERKRAKSNHSAYRHRGQRAHGNGKGSTRATHRGHIDVVDVNHAGVDALARVPGMTEDLARRIVAYRALVGPFTTLDDLSDLDGLSEGRLISLGRYLVVR